MEEMRVCRFCGHIDAAHSTGRCPTCDTFFGFAVVPRPEAERLARRRRRARALRRHLPLFVALALCVGGTLWMMRALWDIGFAPPPPTTSISASVAPHTWAQVRRTPQNDGFIPDPAPWPRRLLWTYRTDKPLLASPAVLAPHVYLASGDGRLLALDQHRGYPVWEHHTGAASSSTPAVAGEMVIFATRPGRVIALDRHTGAQRWEVDLKSPILASPIVMHGTVYLGAADQRLYALDAATGQQRWTFVAKDWIVSAVAHADSRIVVPSRRNYLHVLSLDTGRQRFIYATGKGRHIGGGVAIQGDLAYFGTSGGRVWAIDWRATTYAWERLLLFGHSNLYLWGVLSTPPIQKGSVWSQQVGGDVVHTPAIAHHLLYVTTSRGKVVALDIATGGRRWTTDLGVAITVAPTVAGTTVLVGTEGGVVFGLEAHTGAIQWEFKTAAKVSGSPIVVGHTMYVASSDGTLSAATEME
jgi:outer membrane protein assembly factor BamB